jgi:hypothetical protein
VTDAQQAATAGKQSAYSQVKGEAAVLAPLPGSQHLGGERDAAMAVLMMQGLMLFMFLGTCVGVVYYLLQLLK